VVTDFHAHNKWRDALVIERWADSRRAAGMALIAVLHEHALAFGKTGIVAKFDWVE